MSAPAQVDEPTPGTTARQARRQARGQAREQAREQARRQTGRRTRRSTWRARASLAEGLANLRDGALLGTALVAIATLVIGGALLTDVLTAARVVRAESAYLDAGGDLLVAQGQNGATLDAARCVSLAHLTGVRTAFAVTVKPGAAELVGRPESRQALVLATAGVLDLFDAPDLGPDDVLLSQIIADRWQWDTGAHLQLDALSAVTLGAPTGVLTVAGTVDLARLAEGASTGVLLLQPPTGPVDTCFVRIEPQYRDVLRATIPAVLGETSGRAVTVADRLPAGASAVDPVAAFDARTTRWSGAAAGAVVGLLWAIVAWTRRGRAALYASIGVPYSGGVLLRWTEGVTIVLVGALWGTLLATTVAVTLLDAPPTLAVDIALRGGALAAAVALALVVAVGLWRPSTLTALKDR